MELAVEYIEVNVHFTSPPVAPGPDTHGVKTRNSFCDDVHIAIGSAGKLRLKAGATYLCDMALSAAPFAPPSSGAMTANAISEGTVTATGTVDNCEVSDSGNTVVYAGAIPADMQIDIAALEIDNKVNVDGGTLIYTAPP